MNETAMLEPDAPSVEHVLREELAQGDSTIATARPILRHLLANDDHALFSDEVIARIRGMLRDVAAQLLEAQAEAAGISDRPEFVAARQDELAQPLLEDAAFLSHGHALAVEAQVAERLRARSGIDPVLTPLIQEAAASSDPGVAAGAMGVLAAQARFIQYHRRMELPLRDLPGDLFHKALLSLRAHPGEHPEAAATAERRLREGYAEGEGRMALLARLVASLEGRAARALALDHAGLSIFATALAMASGQDRDLAVLTLTGRQYARLALALRAAGLGQAAVEAQFLYLHPDVSLPEGFDRVRSDTAAALLAAPLPDISL